MVRHPGKEYLISLINCLILYPIIIGVYNATNNYWRI